MEGEKREMRRDETRQETLMFIFMFMYDVFSVGTNTRPRAHQLVGLGGFCSANNQLLPLSYSYRSEESIISA